MKKNLEHVSLMLRTAREARGLTQEQLAEQAGTNRTIIAHIEQSLKFPDNEMLRGLWTVLGLKQELLDNVQMGSQIVIDFESGIAEFVGHPASLNAHTVSVIESAHFKIHRLFEESLSPQNTLSLLNSIFVYYGIHQMSSSFFDRYLKDNAFGSCSAFMLASHRYQVDAIRLFSTLREAYISMNRSANLENLLSSLQKIDLVGYQSRSEWNYIESISDDRLPDLGYISAQRIRQEDVERRALQRFLIALAKDIRSNGPTVVGEQPEKTRRKMDSLMRKFDSRIEHGLFSPLFAPDPGALEREAARLAPKSENEIVQIARTQDIALKNLSFYLTADYMDVYVATSMRTDADFISVDRFVKSVFLHPRIRPLKLRYFNPTLSWIEDRIAKGLVEALMLKRSKFTIYMAQKTDTFGKDSEASVALGQGKPVIVYVPKLIVKSDKTIDTENLFRMDRNSLLSLLKGVTEGSDDMDESLDEQALISRFLVNKIRSLPDIEIVDLVNRHWADFDLHSEVERIKTIDQKDLYRNWLDSVIKPEGSSRHPIPDELRDSICGILVAVAIRFESRAKLFREVHPLALQVILSSGVLNGILVVRSSDQCAQVLCSLISNTLELERQADDNNYRLVEKITGSTIRVVTRHKLLMNAFDSFYAQSSPLTGG